jgi:hypothetical protein
MSDVAWMVRDLAADEEIPEPEVCPDADESDLDEAVTGDGQAR